MALLGVKELNRHKAIASHEFTNKAIHVTSECYCRYSLIVFAYDKTVEKDKRSTRVDAWLPV